MNLTEMWLQAETVWTQCPVQRLDVKEKVKVNINHKTSLRIDVFSLRWSCTQS